MRQLPKFERIDGHEASSVSEALLRHSFGGLSVGLEDTGLREWHSFRQALVKLPQFGMGGESTGFLFSELLVQPSSGAANIEFEHLAFRDAIRMIELGRVCPPLRAHLTAHSIVCHALREFASGEELLEHQRLLNIGRLQASLALTESEGGSNISSFNARSIDTDGGTLSVTAEKRWITGGQTADVALVFVSSDAGPIAILVNAEEQGVCRRDESAIGALAGYGLSSWTLSNVVLPRSRIVGELGIATSHIAPDCLAYGRLCVAAGAVGIVLGCLAEVLVNCRKRHTADGRLLDLQLVRRLITRLHCSLETSFLLCMKAAILRDQRSPDFHLCAMEAKYHCVEAAIKAAESATQLCGAASFMANSPLPIYVMESAICNVIEGSATVCENTIPSYLELIA